MVAKGQGVGEGMEWEVGVSRCKLLYMEWINNKVLLDSTENYIQYHMINHNGEEGPSRWWRNKRWRSPSSPQIHQKYIYMWNNSKRTPTECWQKTSDFPKGKKLPTYKGRAKEERKNRDKRIGMGPELLGGSCEG